MRGRGSAQRARDTGEFDTLKHVRRFLCLVDNLRKTLDDVMLPGCSSHEGHTVHSSCSELSEMFCRFCICDPRDVLSVAGDEAATQNVLYCLDEPYPAQTSGTTR